MGGRGSSSGNTSRLPALQGSEKQVKWATDLRDNVVKIIKEESRVFEKNKSYFDNDVFGDQEAYKDYKKYSREALKVTNASKWINSFKNMQYKTDSYIKSLEKPSYLSETAYRAEITEKMKIASYAYKKFVTR